MSGARAAHYSKTNNNMGETMGLDMYAYTTKARINADVDFSEPQKYDELHYWRKHPNLHGWMKRLYQSKGGQNPDFNLDTLRLTTEDLDQLEQNIQGRGLPETSGFFFGQSDGSEVEDDLEFVGKARAAIAQGMTVYYQAWW
jgi:hypothetical protein